MFDLCKRRLGGVFDGIRGRGALSEADVELALKEVRAALLDADVALPVVTSFIDKVRPRAMANPSSAPSRPPPGGQDRP